MATTPNLGLSQLTEDENFDIDTYNGDNLKVDTFAGTIPKEKTLYSNANGSSNTIALNDSAANYTKISIEYTDNANVATSIVTSRNGQKTQLLTVTDLSNNNFGFKLANVTPSGTSITWDTNKEIQLPSGTIGIENPIKITKVVGIK